MSWCAAFGCSLRVWVHKKITPGSTRSGWKKVAGVEVSIIFGAVNVSIGGLIAGQMACFDLEPCSQINPPSSAFEVVFYLARERAPQRLFIMLIIIWVYFVGSNSPMHMLRWNSPRPHSDGADVHGNYNSSLIDCVNAHNTSVQGENLIPIFVVLLYVDFHWGRREKRLDYENQVFQN